MADAFLHHDRPITRPADDSVVRIIAGRARPIRLGRGIAPLELTLPRALTEPVLAVGGHLKITVALAWDRRIVISPHIGDMGTLRSEEVFAQVVADLQRLYDVRATACCATHIPTTRRHAGRAPADCRCTACSITTRMRRRCVAEHGAQDEPAIVFAWDGVGLRRATARSGAARRLSVEPGHWQRRASLRPFSLPGGDKAGRAPWRSAAALCWEIGGECPVAVARSDRARGMAEAHQLTAVERGGTPVRRRRRDRARHRRDQLRRAGPDVARGDRRTCRRVSRVAAGRADADGVARIDWAPLVAWLLRIERRAAAASARVPCTRRLPMRSCGWRSASVRRLGRAAATVGLTGGVFQNRCLSELAAAQLQQRGISRAAAPVQFPAMTAA